MGKMILNGKEYAGSGSEWHEYSTNEKIVGKWIDGKPLYEKTFSTTSLPSTGTRFELADLSSLNIDKVVHAEGMLIHNDLKQFVVLGAYNPADSGVYSCTFMLMSRNGYTDQTPVIQIRFAGSGNPFVSYKECFVTIQYTKTTD